MNKVSILKMKTQILKMRFIYINILWLVAFLLTTCTVFSQVDFVIKTAQISKLDTVAVLIDKNYSFHEILTNPDLKFTKQDKINVYGADHYWIKCTVETIFGYDKPYFIWTTPAFSSELYYFDEENNKWQSNRGGDLISNNTTIFKCIPCVFKAHEPTTFYIKVDVKEVNDFQQSIKTELYFEDQNLSYATRKEKYDWWLATVAIVLAFWIFNLYWYIMIREKAYLYYLILILGGIIYITSVGSFMSYFFVLKNITAIIAEDHVIIYTIPEFTQMLVGLSLLFFGFVNFTRSYLKSAFHFPILDKYLRYATTLFLGYQVVLLIVEYSKLSRYYDYFGLINNLILLTLLAFITTITLRCNAKKTPESKYFIKAFTIPTFFIFIIVVYIIVTKNNDIISFLSNLAILSITISFGILLVAKVNLIKKELSDEKFAKQAIVAQNEIEQERNLRLQEKIEYDKNEVAAAQHIKLLMKELHHRVKNNLQIVSSLLSLQSFRIKDQAAIDAVKEGQHRIEAMSLIHQKLYVQDNITQVNIQEFITDIAESLMEAYGFNKQIFQLEIYVSEELLDVDKAIPLSIIINELITNAFKYAFITVKNPKLKISFTKKYENATLLVSDNGIGMDVDAWKNNDGYGKELVSTFTEQLSGTLTLSVNDGTTFKIDFPF